MENDIFSVLIESATNERIDRIIIESEGYKQIKEEYKTVLEEYDRMELTEEQQKVIGRLLDEHSAMLAYFAEMNYRQALYDCVTLLKELKVI